MAMDDMSPHVVGRDIGTAFTRVLDSRLKNVFPHRYRTIHISEPVTTLNPLPAGLDWDEWEEHINAGEALSGFESYEFHDGTTGRYWVQDRIEELFDGMYASRLAGGDRGNQIEQITERLKQGNHGQTTNALVAQVFQQEPDLRHATHGRPLAPDMACMTQLQFRPEQDTLNLYAIFRSQYLDTKCYGNLISLAALLAVVCQRSGYEPGYILETAHNTTFRDYEDAQDLHRVLTRNEAWASV